MSRKTISEDRQEEAFRAIERAARRGERCPSNNGPEGLRSDVMAALAKSGSIVVMVSGKNYRTVEICCGACTNKTTAPDPSGSPIWKVLDREGLKIKGRRYVPKDHRP